MLEGEGFVENQINVCGHVNCLFFRPSWSSVLRKICRILWAVEQLRILISFQLFWLSELEVVSFYGLVETSDLLNFLLLAQMIVLLCVHMRIPNLLRQHFILLAVSVI